MYFLFLFFSRSFSLSIVVPPVLFTHVFHLPVFIFFIVCVFSVLHCFTVNLLNFFYWCFFHSLHSSYSYLCVCSWRRLYYRMCIVTFLVFLLSLFFSLIVRLKSFRLLLQERDRSLLVLLFSSAPHNPSFLFTPFAREIYRRKSGEIVKVCNAPRERKYRFYRIEIYSVNFTRVWIALLSLRRRFVMILSILSLLSLFVEGWWFVTACDKDICRGFTCFIFTRWVSFFLRFSTRFCVYGLKNLAVERYGCKKLSVVNFVIGSKSLIRRTCKIKYF